MEVNEMLTMPLLNVQRELKSTVLKNCDSRDEYYGLVGYRGCIRGYYLHRKVWQTALANFVLSGSVHFSIASTLAVARGLRETLLEVSRLTNAVDI